MTLPDFIQIQRGDAPLLLSVPHAGTDLPPDIAAALVSEERGLGDADWHMDHVYAFARSIGATIVRTSISRTVIDVNRDPSGQSLYPGQSTTSLVSEITFDGLPMYREGQEPDEAEIARRKEAYYLPYHAALQAEVNRLRATHPRIVLYDCHSIRSLVPRLFDGLLPVFNIGTNKGQSADPELTRAVVDACAKTGQSLVLNGRFVGGWITRHYGRPQNGVHAIQMELAQRFYMDEYQPTVLPQDKAAEASAQLGSVLQAVIGWLDAG